MNSAALPTAVPTSASTDRTFFAFVAVVSAVALSFLAWLLMLRTAPVNGATNLAFLPAVNASFNATSAVCLVLGYVAIKNRKPHVHRTLMALALLSSALFLVSYIAYHYGHGDTKYAGTGFMRPLYFTVLITHVLLSIPVLPMALVAVYFALTRRFDSHVRVTKIALPIWLYVSVTGVLVFFMLR